MKTSEQIAAQVDLNADTWPTVPGPKTVQIIREKIAAAIEADRAQRTVWTLTVDDDSGIATTVHPSEAAALDSLYNNYAEPEWPRDNFIQGLIDTQGLVIYIEEHSV